MKREYPFRAICYGVFLLVGLAGIITSIFEPNPYSAIQLFVGVFDIAGVIFLVYTRFHQLGDEVDTWTLVPALCAVCGEPVPNAFRDENGKLVSKGGGILVVCFEGDLVYHFEKGKDCWGKHTGVPNF